MTLPGISCNFKMDLKVERGCYSTLLLDINVYDILDFY